MPKYVVTLVTWANSSVEVETDSTDPNEIAALAERQFSGASLCHQCAGDVDLGDEWSASSDTGEIYGVTRIEEKS